MLLPNQQSQNRNNLRRWLPGFVWMLLGFAWMLTEASAAVAQVQFVNQPKVLLAGGRVASFLTGNFQTGSAGTDFLYIGTPTGSGANSSVTVGELLSTVYQTEPVNQIKFTGVSNVAATLADFNQDGTTDYAFALTAATGVSLKYNLCVYYGTGSSSSSISSSSYEGGNAVPPSGSKSGCIAFAIQSGAVTPVFSYIAALKLTTSSKYPQILVEDSANNLLYVISVDNTFDYSGSATSTDFKVLQTITLPSSDGVGPIYTGGYNSSGFANFFDSKGNSYFFVNGQTNGTVTLYVYDSSTRLFAEQAWAVVPGIVPSIHSMLLQDMDGDGIPDMVTEGANGVLGIYPGKGDGTFDLTNQKWTFPTGNGLSGNGGKLALISDNIGGVAGHIEILTTTAMGLSVFENTGSYSLNYTLKNIYNIGSGHTSFALDNSLIQNSGTMDLAVDSPEGVAVLTGDTNGDGLFQSSYAFPTYSPALSAVVGQFRTTGNPNNNLDVAAATESAGTVQGRLLEGNGASTFTSATNAINTSTVPSGIASNLWPNIVAGDFNGDANLDIAYTLTGLPLPTTGTGLYVQYGNGDGTFQTPVAVNPGAPSGNTFYGASVAGDFNGDGYADIANIDAGYVDTLLGQSSTTVPFNLGMNQAVSGTSLNLVAAGYFTTKTSAGVAKTSKQDLVAQQGASLIPYANSGDGKTFTKETALSGTMSASSGYAVSALLLVDINNDGYGDVIALYHNLASDPSNPSTNTPNYLYVWYGKGDGTFSSTPFTLQLDRNFYMAAVADMDSNGFNDLVLSDGYLVGILFNTDNTKADPTIGNFVADCKTGSQLGSCSTHNEAHYLAGQGINAIVPVALAGDKKMDLVVANGGVTIANPLVLGGATQTSATLAVDPVVNTGGITVLRNNISTQPVTATLTASHEPSDYGATFTITAVVTPASGTTVPSGTVTFSIDGTQVCGPYSVYAANNPSTAPAYSASTICTIASGNTYPVGTHTLSASYSGDSNYSALTFTGSHVIQGGTTTTTLFMCIGPTTNCPATGLPVVTTPYPTALSMIYGQIWNGVATVTSSDSNQLLGDTVFTLSFNGGSAQSICTLPTSVGGTCPAVVGTTVGTSVGTNVITASYVPGTADTVHSGSSSTPVTITVLQDPGTSVVITSGSPNPAMVGTAVTFTATVSGTYAVPTGTVAFMYGSTTLCASSALTASASGVTSTASCTTSVLPVGSDAITASYAETTDFIGATSAAYVEQITLPASGNFNITVTPNPVNLGVGYGTLLTVTVTANSAKFTQDVTLACGNLPNEASCTFTSPTITGGSGTTQVYLNTAAPHTCGTSSPYFVGSNGGGSGLAPIALPALAGLIAIFLPSRRRTAGRRLIPSRRRWLRALAVVLLTAGAAQMTGCSTCTDLGTRPGTYTFHVSGTAAGTGEVESQNVTLTITI